MPKDPARMYRWRRLSDDERLVVGAERRQHARPPHSVPHVESDTTCYCMITAACFEHRHVIGKCPQRMSKFERDFVEVLNEHCNQIFAWTVLPNHYHCLVDAPGVDLLLKSLGKLHGRNSFFWNGEDDARGRQVWCNAAETAMKSEGHFYASLNYVLNNAVRHGYAQKWTDWPYCNAAEYLKTMGRDKALRIWNAYPLLDYGKDWDPPDL